MTRHLLTETLTPEKAELARYYAGEIEPLSMTEQLGNAVAEGGLGFADAVADLMRAEIALASNDADIDDIHGRVMTEIAGAAMRAESRSHIAEQGGSVASVRPDVSPQMADRLGIDPLRPPREDEIAHLLNGRRADGEPIVGKQQHKPMLSVAEVFGLDGKKPPEADGLEHVLAGRRADGKAPVSRSGKPLPETVVQGAHKRFLGAYGVPGHREPTPDEIVHMKAGRAATGLALDRKDYRQAINATRPPIAYVDMIWSADKSLSVAFGLSPTEAERSMLVGIHDTAVAGAMAYAEQRLGYARKGKNGQDGREPGELFWVTFRHYTARPVAEIARPDSQGRPYTDLQEVPLQTADMQLHSHATAMNCVLTKSGRVGSMDLDELDGLVKELGAVYQGIVAREASGFGIEVELDAKTGAARLTAIPDSVRQHFSKRTANATDAAKEFAKEAGLGWDSLSPERQVALLRKGAEESRHKKARVDGLSDFAVWQKQAADEIGYHHRSVLRPDEIKPELTTEQRRELAYQASLPLIEDALSRRAKLSWQEMREFAARGFIAAGGIGDNPAEDIAAVAKLYGERGVRQDGLQTAITRGKDVPIRGKGRWSVTTELHEEQEVELIDLARKAASNKSHALSSTAIERAASAFLARNPRIDPNGKHWREQYDIARKLGEGGALSVAVGVGGAGKSTILGVLVDAWKADGRTVFGATVGWKQTAPFAKAGVDADRRASIAAFLKRVERGRYVLDRNSVIVIDELSQLGKRQFLDLARLQDKYGCQVVMTGDPKQCQSVEAPMVPLLHKALGEDAIPQILISIRQKTERTREVASLFRQGRAAEALEMKREDGTAILVTGGRDTTIAKVAQLWRERMEANANDPDFTISISAPTNADARAIGVAVRKELRNAGKLGDDMLTLKATDRTDTYDLSLATGDTVRVFDRLYVEREALASNGDLLEVRALFDHGVKLRNEDGREGFVPWEKLQKFGSPIRLAHGYATTVDAAQSRTSTEHIDAMPGGSKTMDGFRGYTAESRHERVSHMVISESAERQEIARKHPLGVLPVIREADIWANVERNLSRQDEKVTALDFLGKATDLKRGAVSTMRVGLEPAERRQAAGLERTTLHRTYARARMERSMERAAEQMRRVTSCVRQVHQRIRPARERAATREAPELHQHQGQEQGMSLNT